MGVDRDCASAGAVQGGGQASGVEECPRGSAAAPPRHADSRLAPHPGRVCLGRLSQPRHCTAVGGSAGAAQHRSLRRDAVLAQPRRRQCHSTPHPRRLRTFCGHARHVDATNGAAHSRRRHGHSGGPEGPDLRQPAGRVCASAGTDPGHVPGFPRYQRGGVHRLRDRGPLGHAAGACHALQREDRPAAAQLPTQRQPAQTLAAQHPSVVRLARRRVGDGQLQPELQTVAANLRRLDAHHEGRAQQHLVAAGRQRPGHGEPASHGGGVRRRPGANLLCPQGAGGPAPGAPARGRLHA